MPRLFRPRLAGIDHLLLIVPGMNRAETFYTEVIGCEVEQRLPEYGMMVLQAGASWIELVDVDVDAGNWARTDGPGRNVDHFCLRTDHWDETEMRDHLARHDVVIFEEALHSDADGTSLSFYIRDPFGNAIELKRPAS